VVEARYLGTFTPSTWDVQTRPKLIQPFVAASVDQPPPSKPVALSGPLASHYAPPVVTPLWGRAITVEGAAVTPVDDPPFKMRERQDQPIDLFWIPRLLTGIGRAVGVDNPGTVDNPPFSAKKYTGDFTLSTWNAQTSRKVPVSVSGVPVVVNDPPFSGKKYAGEWPVVLWESQARPHLIPANVPQTDTPPVLEARYLGDFTLLTWDAQTTRKLAQPFIAPVNDPPFTAARYRGEWPDLTWAAQARPKLTQEIPPPVNDPPFSSARYLGDFTLATWKAQARLQLTPPDGPVIQAASAGVVPIRYVVGVTENVVPVETVTVAEAGVVPCRVTPGTANVVPVRETNTEVPRVKIILV
jgi:hypothetical protein